MNGRGARVIDPNDLQAVTADAKAKTGFVIVDCVGVTEQDMVDTRSLDKQPSVPLEKLLQHVGIGGTTPDVISTLASRLARLDKQLDETKRASLQGTAKGVSPHTSSPASSMLSIPTARPRQHAKLPGWTMLSNRPRSRLQRPPGRCSNKLPCH